MRFTIERETLVKMLNWVSRTIQPRPILIEQAGIEIEAKEGNLTFITTNTETIAKTTELLKIEEEGKVLVLGQIFSEIVRTLPNEKITIEKKENKLEIKTQKIKVDLPVIQEQPLISTINEADKIGEINVEEMKKAITQVAIAASKEETAPQLTAIKAEIKNKEITFCALDRYRIAKKTIAFNGDAEENFLIRAKTLIDLMATCENIDKIELLREKDNLKKVIFKVGDSVLSTQEIAGEFPQTQPLFEEQHENETIVNKTEIEKALNRASIIIKKNPNITLNIKSNEIEISQEEDDKKSEETITAKHSGQEITIKFNLNYLKEGISQIEEEEIVIKSKDFKPVRIVGKAEKENYVYIIVPIRQQ